MEELLEELRRANERLARTIQRIERDHVAKKEIKVDQVVVKVHDGPMLLPEGLSDAQAIKVLERKIAYEQQTFGVHAEFDCFIWEAAYAFSRVLEREYGWAGARTKVIEGFFGPMASPPTMIGVKIGFNETVQIPWGEFAIPGIAGYLESSMAEKQDGRHVFVLQGEVKRKDEAKINKIINLIREEVRTNSIYKGKAFALRLMDDNGKPFQFPELDFLKLYEEQEKELVLPKATERMVRVNMFTPIERTAEVRQHKVPLKLGALLAGPFGTGKTMIANVVAVKAVRNGWTYIEVRRADELAGIIRVARQYQPCVVFCEDIDSVVSGERNVTVDQILNVVDGVESKGTEIMVVLTTNSIEKIHPALLRPGRLDKIITVGPPDEAAAEVLARQYSRGLIHEDEPLERSPRMMAGLIPATIREIVERSKLAAIDTIEPGGEFKIADDDLVVATMEMEEHIRRATPRPEDTRTDREKAADRLGTHLERAALIDNGFAVRDLGELVGAYQLMEDEASTLPELLEANQHGSAS